MIFVFFIWHRNQARVGNLIYIYILDFSRLCRLHEMSKASGLLSLRSCALSSEAEAHNIEASF